MKHLIITSLILFFSPSLLAQGYEINCLSEAKTPFYKAISVSGDLTVSDYSHDGAIDTIEGSLNINFPYMNKSFSISIFGEATNDDYIHEQYLFAKPKVINNNTELGNVIEIVESPYRGGPYIRLIHDFDTYQCYF